MAARPDPLDELVRAYTEAAIRGTPIKKEELLARVRRRQRAELMMRLNQEDFLLDLGAAKRRSMER